ncbi:MAG: hypothetical protein GX896_00285 [Clostridiales bacterium]|nr:hypothetical protein [Clostridiales bacterium]
MQDNNVKDFLNEETSTNYLKTDEETITEREFVNSSVDGIIIVKVISISCIAISVLLLVIGIPDSALFTLVACIININIYKKLELAEIKSKKLLMISSIIQTLGSFVGLVSTLFLEGAHSDIYVAQAIANIIICMAVLIVFAYFMYINKSVVNYFMRFHDKDKDFNDAMKILKHEKKDREI